MLNKLTLTGANMALYGITRHGIRPLIIFGVDAAEDFKDICQGIKTVVQVVSAVQIVKTISIKVSTVVHKLRLIRDNDLKESKDPEVVILNGDSPTPTRVIEGVVQPFAPTTIEQRLAKKNELKAHGTLLMALPDKHQLKFNIHKDAKTLMEAIEKRFGGNKETKKKLISQLEILRESLSQEDINLKFLRSLPTEWRTHTLIWRNKKNLEEQSLDDFTNEPISAAASVSAGSAKIHVSALPNIDANDLEEMDLKWQMAMLTVECYNCHRKGHFSRECRSPKDTKRNDAAEPQRRNVPVETFTSNALVSQYDFRKSQFDVISYKTELESVDARLLVYQQNEYVFEEDIKLLKLEVQLRDNALVVLRQKFEKAEQERDDLKLKLEKFQTSSKNLSQLLASQTNDKTILDYNTQVFTRFMFDCDEFFTSESDESLPPSPIYDRYQSGDGYHVVPPPYTGTFMPPKPELVFHNAPNVNETVHTAFNVKLSPTKPDKDLPSVKPVETSIPAANPKTTIPKPKSHGYNRNRKACFVLLTQSKLVPISAARPVTAVAPKPYVTRPRQATTIVAKPYSPSRRNINHSASPKASNFSPKVTTAKAPMVNAVKGVQGKWEWKPKCPILDHGNPQHALKDKRIIDIGCSRHMTGNMSYLSNFKAINGGYVAFGGNPKGGKISRKGKIKTGKLDFNDVYFVKELKFNLFSVSQMCDKKNNVLFTDTECIVLSPEFKLLDENQVLLRVPRENNMYNVDLKNIFSSGDFTCLFAKAILDESNLWHRRLGLINFKTMNKLVKGNLVRGLPSKVFENDHICVACKKGKQHKASCKTKPVSSVNQPLQRLHIDLFGPTFVKSLNKKIYCLVVTDDYSRFTWVFFLATKDETSPILKTFIIGIEHQLSLKVKIIRSDNGTELKNNDLNQFCGMKGVNREFSVPRTPQQNGIAERKIRTLIEAARTMLAELLLPIPFWAEAVNTACYVQNRVLVTKPQNKTPYELLLGRTPSIGIMRPFGYPVTILNTLDPLGKFDRNVDEGFLVGYSISSKAFRVFNSRTQIVQETLHINFLENKPNVVVSGPTWLFGIDTLTKTMNYQPVTAGNQSNPSAGVQEQFDTEKVGEENVQQYVLFPVWTSVSNNPQNTDGDVAFKVKEPEFEGRKPESKVNVSPSSSAQSKKHDDKTKRKAKGTNPVESSTGYRNLSAEFKDFSDNSINKVNAAGSLVPAVGQIFSNSNNTFSAAGPSNTAVSPTHKKSSYVDTSQLPDDPNMPELEDITYSDDEEDVSAKADFTNLETIITVSPILTTRVHKDHSVTQIIGDLSLATQTRSMTRVAKDQGGLSQINNDDFHTCMFAYFLSQEEPKRVHQALKDPIWIEAIQEELLQFKMQKVWVLVDLPNRKKAIGTKWVFRNKKDERGIVVRNKARLVAQGHTQEKGIDYEEVFALVVRIEAIRLFLDYAFFIGFMVYQMDVKSAFMYGTIEEEVYVCQPPGFEDLDYPDKKQDGIFISQDKYVAEILRKFGLTDGKSTSTPIDTKKPLLKDPDGDDVDVHTYRSMIGSMMYLTSSRPDIMFAGKPHLGLWYPKDLPFNLVAYSDSDYAGASLDRKSTTGGCQFLGCKLISWKCKKQTLVATSSTEAEYVAAASCCAQVLWIQNQLLDYRGYQFLPNEEIFTELARMGYEKPSTKLSFYKAFLSSQWKFLIHIILQCMSAKRTSWNEFSSSMDSTVICLSTGKGFSGVDTPLFKGMIVVQQVDEGAAKVNVDDISAAGVADEGAVSANVDNVLAAVDEPSIPAPTPPTQPPPYHKNYLPLYKLKKVGTAQKVKTSKDIIMDNVSKHGGIIANIDVDEDVTLKDVAKEVVVDAEIEENADDDEIEPAKLKEVVEVVTTAKLITEVVTAASATITTADAPIPAPALTLTTTPSAAKRRKGVEKGIMVHEPKPLKKKTQIQHDKACARELEAKLNKIIDWDEVIEQVKRKEKEDNVVMRNMAGFKMDYFKGMTYDDIHLIFEKKFNSNVAFLMKTKEQMEEEDSRALKRKVESLEDKATKKQKLDEEVKELRKHLQIVPNDDDDVYTEAIPLALKVLVVDYEIYTENNKPYYKIKRDDGIHQLYLSFLSMLRNFDREDLKVLWELVKERFASSKPKNFSDVDLLTTLGAMFGKPDIQA
nr:putative ribonuclease H-like domain-containing protein [Tanacetum cinerariifolium]